MVRTEFVAGYIVKTQNVGYVKHVAVFADGTIKITVNELRANDPNFNTRSTQWVEVGAAVLTGAEFIGRYHANYLLAHV